jgi:arylsulfatase A-like enzyme
MNRRKPNIVYFFSDQHRFDTLGCYGHPHVQTPNLDFIASEGMRFDRAYTACALCSPARASLLTGLYPHNHGMLANIADFNGVFGNSLLDKKGYPEYLSAADYHIGYTGKWHLSGQGNKSFWKMDQWHSGYQKYLQDNGIQYDIATDEVQPLEWGGDAPFFGKSAVPAKHHHDGWVADRCIEMIHDFAKSDQPFMICAAFRGPHFPTAVPEPYDTMYNPADVPMWGNFHETFADKPIVQQKELLRWNTSHLTWPDWQKVIAAYWGYCTYIDAQIGRVIDELKRLELDEETIFIYSSDHGDMQGSHRLFNKGWNMYEECNRIPLLIRWPGVTAPGSVCDEFVNLTDLMPTMLEMGEAAIPEHIDGRSLVPLLNRQKPEDWPDDAYVEFNGYESSLASIRMVRTKKWKYVYNPVSIDELYDMESDPHELYNLAGQLAFKHVLRRMKERMVRRLRGTGDGIVATGPWQSNSYDLFVSDRER